MEIVDVKSLLIQYCRLLNSIIHQQLCDLIFVEQPPRVSTFSDLHKLSISSLMIR